MDQVRGNAPTWEIHPTQEMLRLHKLLMIGHLKRKNSLREQDNSEKKGKMEVRIWRAQGRHSLVTEIHLQVELWGAHRLVDLEEWEEDRCSLAYQEVEVWVRKLMVKMDLLVIIMSIFRITTIKTLAVAGNLQCMVEEASVHPCMTWSLKTSRTI